MDHIVSAIYYLTKHGLPLDIINLIIGELPERIERIERYHHNSCDMCGHYESGVCYICGAQGCINNEGCIYHVETNEDVCEMLPANSLYCMNCYHFGDDPVDKLYPILSFNDASYLN